ncbi:MAG: hypothetical protein LAT63_10530 [Marinobacter sp.]|nr:hypothetical protein [Marinobacter sp.]
MEVSVSEALDALNSRLATLLPSIDAPLDPEIQITPERTHTAGIGGYVGKHQDPFGEIHARRVKAQVIVRVKADSLAELSAMEASVTRALVAASPSALRTQGIFRITRDTDYQSSILNAGDGLSANAGRDLRFHVDFEYRRLPDAPAGVIEDLFIDTLLHRTDNVPDERYNNRFLDDPLADFTQFDDSDVNNGPGQWGYDSDQQAIVQTSAITGGSNGFNASKRGTLLVLNPSVVSTTPEHWLLHAQMDATHGGIGLIFNFRDINNYHFLLLNLPTPYTLLAQKSQGEFSFMAEGGQAQGVSYTADQTLSIRLARQGDEYSVRVNDAFTLAARDHSGDPPGLVGLFCRNNATARFRSLRWIAL